MGWWVGDDVRLMVWWMNEGLLVFAIGYNHSYQVQPTHELAPGVRHGTTLFRNNWINVSGSMRNEAQGARREAPGMRERGGLRHEG